MTIGVILSACQPSNQPITHNCRINSPYATNGPHSVSAATTKGDLALVFIAAANDKQVRMVGWCSWVVLVGWCLWEAVVGWCLWGEV